MLFFFFLEFIGNTTWVPESEPSIANDNTSVDCYINITSKSGVDN